MALSGSGELFMSYFVTRWLWSVSNRFMRLPFASLIVVTRRPGCSTRAGDDEPPQLGGRVHASTGDDPARQFPAVGHRLEPSLSDGCDADSPIPFDSILHTLVGYVRQTQPRRRLSHTNLGFHSGHGDFAFPFLTRFYRPKPSYARPIRSHPRAVSR